MSRKKTAITVSKLLCRLNRPGVKAGGCFVTVNLIDRRIVAENSRWRVYFDNVILDHNRQVSDFLVISPLHMGPNLCSGVSIVAEKSGEIGLLTLYRHATSRWGREVIKGFLDDNEAPEQAALRELAEEAGLICDPDDLIPLGAIAPEAGTIEGLSLGYLARNCRILEAPPESDDARPDQFAWYSQSDVQTLALGGDPSVPEMIDSISLVCILRAMNSLHAPKAA
jgi:ADP-ribose pyrophosphatase